MMLLGILHYRLKAAPSFMASFSRQRDIDTYMCIYIFYKGKIYTYLIYVYIHIWG